MNFFPFPSIAQSPRSDVNLFQQLGPIDLRPIILNSISLFNQVITVALTMDFTRFENKIRSEIILQELGNKDAKQVPEKIRP